MVARSPITPLTSICVESRAGAHQASVWPMPVPTRNPIGVGRASDGVMRSPRCDPKPNARHAISEDDPRLRGRAVGGRRRGAASGRAPRATVRRRDVRSGDASRRRAGLGRSCRRLAVLQPAGREHPSPACRRSSLSFWIRPREAVLASRTRRSRSDSAIPDGSPTAQARRRRFGSSGLQPPPFW